MPSAPIDNQQLGWPFPIPPDATNGIVTLAPRKKNHFGISSSPGWPPHSKPSTLTASQPIFFALRECLTEDIEIFIGPLFWYAPGGFTCSFNYFFAPFKIVFNITREIRFPKTREKIKFSQKVYLSFPFEFFS
ncbi:MAG: hypothetical protein CM15mP22_3750 [Gammaproteobacteria bacterium]|nr:MAG: hypothetical protein CM15mP22_3750 [Gammaproteobacteria bacterium]